MEDALPESEISTEPDVPPKVEPKKRVLSEAALGKLRIARESAARANRAKKEARDAAKKELEDQKKQREEEIQRSKDPIVIVEQSASDSEDLECAAPGVILVRRKRAKPKKTEADLEMDKHYFRMFG